MGVNSGIQWTQNTWNPHIGCRKISQGCRNCYAEKLTERWGKDFSIVVKSKTTFNAPLKWKEPKLIFTCSMSDFFIEEADTWRNELWDIIKATPQHTYQILTKRPERILQCLPPDWSNGCYQNVWLGTTVEDNKAINRITELKKVPAIVRFLSMEPLLEQVPLSQNILNGISWILVGGESGTKTGKYAYRPCEHKWMEQVVNDCKGTGVSVFVKQMGSHLAYTHNMSDTHGGNIEEFPVNLQIRQFPVK